MAQIPPEVIQQIMQLFGKKIPGLGDYLNSLGGQTRPEWNVPEWTARSPSAMRMFMMHPEAWKRMTDSQREELDKKTWNLHSTLFDEDPTLFGKLNDAEFLMTPEGQALSNKVMADEAAVYKKFADENPAVSWFGRGLLG